jgi:hypothetical protein
MEPKTSSFCSEKLLMDPILSQFSPVHILMLSILMLVILSCGTVVQLRLVVSGCPHRWPEFDPTSGHVGFVADNVALGGFPLPILIPPIVPN